MMTMEWRSVCCGLEGYPVVMACTLAMSSLLLQGHHTHFRKDLNEVHTDLQPIMI